MPRISNKQTKQLLKFESEKYKIPPDRSSVGAIRILDFNVWPRVIPNGWRNSFSIPRLIDFTNALGLSGDKNERFVLDHQKRLGNRLAVYLLVFTPLIFALVFVPTIALIVLLLINGYAAYLSLAVTLFMVFPVEFLLIRSAFILLDKYFADSLCIQTSLGVLVELTHPNVLTNPIRKRFLLFYINSVARYVLLLHLCFRGSSEAANKKAREHFNKIERFIREQEVLATIPNGKSLIELQKNFLMLTKMFISGAYGDFEWQEEDEFVELAREVPLSWYQSLMIWVGKVVALGIPIIGLYYIYINPDIFSGLPIDVKSLTLFALAWLFLSIDSILQLGLTAKIVATAKEIKELI